MATINLGAIKFNWKGAYNNSTAYVVDDVVSSGGSSYVCILASQGNAVSNGTYWQIMAEGGDVATTLTTQGDVLYRDGSGLQRLAAGTSGQFLKTQGSGANPVWGTPAGIISSALTTDSTTRTTTSTSFTKASNTLDLVVTPASTASKFLIGFTGNVGIDATSQRAWFTIFRDSTNLAPSGQGMVTHEIVGGGSYQYESATTITYLDSPNTSSQITYSFQAKGQGGNTVCIGGESTGQAWYIEF